MKTRFPSRAKRIIRELIRGVFIFLTTSAAAQDLYNETTMFIPSGLTLLAGGNFTNTGFLQNNGTFALGGNWLNGSIYQGTGVVVLFGNDQIIANNDQAIEHLSINGGGTKTLQGTLYINSKINFTNGILLVADVDTLVLNKGAAAVEGSVNSYVDGAMTTIGTGYKFFPIGKNGKYRPVELLDTKGINPTIEVEVFENLPAIQTSIPAYIDAAIYWSRKTISGTFEGSQLSVAYDVQDTLDLSRLILVSGESLDSKFSAIDNLILQPNADLDLLISRRYLNGNIFAVGELISAPPRPYYLSTSLSPESTNPDNRTIKVFGNILNPTDFYFQVFNRWGLMIFESKSFTSMATDGWDGTQNGSQLASGVYPYGLRYIDSTGTPVQHSGFITIIH